MSEVGGTGSGHAAALEPFAVKSYRYLRLSIVVVVLALLASVLIERSKVSCWQGSISAYFYTPVQAVFVSALVVIGVSLVAIKGSTDWEDVLLNLAGVLAPLVAFVPTSPPTVSCSSIEVVAGDATPYIDNNVLAFADRWRRGDGHRLRRGQGDPHADRRGRRRQDPRRSARRRPRPRRWPRVVPRRSATASWPTPTAGPRRRCSSWSVSSSPSTRDETPAGAGRGSCTPRSPARWCCRSWSCSSARPSTAGGATRSSSSRCSSSPPSPCTGWPRRSSTGAAGCRPGAPARPSRWLPG